MKKQTQLLVITLIVALTGLFWASAVITAQPALVESGTSFAANFDDQHLQILAGFVAVTGEKQAHSESGLAGVYFYGPQYGPQDVYAKLVDVFGQAIDEGQLDTKAKNAGTQVGLQDEGRTAALGISHGTMTEDSLLPIAEVDKLGAKYDETGGTYVDATGHETLAIEATDADAYDSDYRLCYIELA